MGFDWDLVVVGAGPAGCRASELLAQRGLRVLLLDPKAPWEKPCGGGLTAAALENTPELLELRERGKPVHELLTIAPSGASVVVPLREPYLVVSRRSLSEWGLSRAIAAGVTFHPMALAELARRKEGWRIVTGDGDTFHARWIVGADGATSRIRKVVAPGLKPELAPTRVFYPSIGSPPGRAVFRFLPRAEGYVWDFPRPGHHSVGIGVAPGTFNRGALDEALSQHQMAEVGEPTVEAEYAGAVIGTSAWLTGSFDDLGGVDYALLGDAAGLADPATGEGIDYALRSAQLAAAAFDPHKGFVDYPGRVRRALVSEIRRARLVRKILYHPAVAERLVRHARHSPRGALLLAALSDAVNEHGSLTGALWRAVRGRSEDLERGRAICACPDGTGASAPPGA